MLLYGISMKFFANLPHPYFRDHLRRPPREREPTQRDLRPSEGSTAQSLCRGHSIESVQREGQGEGGQI
jgi:hypothetical protein